MTDTDERPLFLQRLFPRSTPARHGAPAAPPLPPDQAKPYARKAFNDEVESLARTPEGERNHRLNVAAFNLSQLVAGGYLDHGQVWDTLRTTALNIGLTATETDATLRSSFDAGTRQPRVVADMGGDPYDAPTVTVLEDAAPAADADDATDPAAPPSLRDRFPAIDWVKLWADETTDDWIVEPIIPARRLVALFSAPKMGKSLLMLELAVHVALGTRVLGVKPDRPRRVLYIDFENDPRGDIRTRLQAMGYTPFQLVDLVYLSFPSMAYLDTYVGGLELLAVAQEYECEVVVIDTISRAVQGEENDNDTWLGFYRNTGLPLKAAGIACVRLDHTGKDESKGMRGGSAKYGDVDAVWAMTRLTDDTYRLECTANRLPITDKVLTVKRMADPLRHVVDMTGRRGLVEQCIDAMEAAGIDLTLPLRDVPKALTDAGHSFGRNVAHDAQRARRASAQITTLED